MQTKHAIAAGLGASVRLRPQSDSGPVGAGLSPSKRQKKETAGHQTGTTADFENQHLDFAGIAQALQIQDVLAGLPALVDRFGGGITHDLAHMTIGELAGLYSRLKTLEGLA
jgi:hypothetical protein